MQRNVSLFVCVQAWRTYYQYHTDYVCAEGKLREAEKQEEKQKQSAAKKLERLIEKVHKYHLGTAACMHGKCDALLI